MYPKDALLIDSEDSLQTSSLFWLRDRLAQLARESDDLLTFERQQIIGDRVADTHLLEAASARHRVGVCLPTEEWVDVSVFFEKVNMCLCISVCVCVNMLGRECVYVSTSECV